LLFLSFVAFVFVVVEKSEMFVSSFLALLQFIFIFVFSFSSISEGLSTNTGPLLLNDILAIRRPSSLSDEKGKKTEKRKKKFVDIVVLEEGGGRVVVTKLTETLKDANRNETKAVTIF
jgi:hypothetical protein